MAAANTSGATTRESRKAETRGRILDAAAQAILAHGIDHVSVSAVMKAAGLTHGTFYAHFESKDDLVAAAVHHAADTYRAKLREEIIEVPDTVGRLERLSSTYLSAEHAENPGNGCFIATLGPEMVRGEGQVADAFSDRVQAGLDMIEDVLRDAGAQDAKGRAIASMATVVGGMILARAAGDEADRDAVLAACRDSLQARGI